MVAFLKEFIIIPDLCTVIFNAFLIDFLRLENLRVRKNATHTGKIGAAKRPSYHTFLRNRRKHPDSSFV